MTRYDLTDEELALIEPLLSPQRPNKLGHPYSPPPPVAHGIFCILATGAPCQIADDRFCRRKKKGLWQQLLEALQAQARHMVQIYFTFAILDGRLVQAPKVTGATNVTGIWFSSKESPQRAGLGKSGDGFRRKIDLLGKGAG